MKKKEEMTNKEAEVIKDKSLDINPDEYEFNTLEDFVIFNKWARKNKIPIRVPTEEFHKKVKVKFQRFDQPENVLKARVRNKDIDWRGQLIPGQIYDLPKPVVKFLNGISEPIYGEVDVSNGSSTKRETKKIGERARFSCQVIDFED